MRTPDHRLILGLYRTRPNADLLTRALDLGVTEIDTAYNYADFAAHHLLADIDPGITRRLAITTKLGFFRDGHSLAPERLIDGAEQAARELNRAPDVLLLHNPERSPDGLTEACETLVRLRESGLCGAWGVSTWDAVPLLGAGAPTPDVLMIRCGLTAPQGTLAAAEQLIAELEPVEVRGMAPFGGAGTDQLWQDVNPAIFLDEPSRARDPGRFQAALAAAFAIPRVAAVAARTSSTSHLTDLHDALTLTADQNTVARYRALLAARPASSPARTKEHSPR